MTSTTIRKTTARSALGLALISALGVALAPTATAAEGPADLPTAYGADVSWVVPDASVGTGEREHTSSPLATAGTISAYDSCASTPLQATMVLGAATAYPEQDQPAPSYDNPRAGGTAVVTAVDGSGAATEVYRWTTPSPGVVTRSAADVAPFTPTAPSRLAPNDAGGVHGPSTWSMSAIVALPEGSEAATLTLTALDGTTVSATADVELLAEGCEAPVPPVEEPVEEPTVVPEPAPSEEAPAPAPEPVPTVAEVEPAPAPAEVEPTRATPQVVLATDLPPESGTPAAGIVVGALVISAAAVAVAGRRRQQEGE